MLVVLQENIEKVTKLHSQWFLYTNMWIINMYKFLGNAIFS